MTNERDLYRSLAEQKTGLQEIQKIDGERAQYLERTGRVWIRPGRLEPPQHLFRKENNYLMVSGEEGMWSVEYWQEEAPCLVQLSDKSDSIKLEGIQTTDGKKLSVGLLPDGKTSLSLNTITSTPAETYYFDQDGILESVVVSSKGSSFRVADTFSGFRPTTAVPHLPKYSYEPNGEGWEHTIANLTNWYSRCQNYLENNKSVLNWKDSSLFRRDESLSTTSS